MSASKADSEEANAEYFGSSDKKVFVDSDYVWFVLCLLHLLAVQSPSAIAGVPLAYHFCFVLAGCCVPECLS